MTRTRTLAAVVLTHLGISLIHGRAHAGAQVPLPLAGTLFVYLVILAGPLIGLTASAWTPRAGAVIVALSMAGALIFGLINHFIITGADQAHVAHVAAPWRTLFGITAALLVVSEAIGVLVGVRQFRSASMDSAQRGGVRRTQEIAS